MTAPGRGTVLVTGGAGFIGSHLAERLLERGRRVVVLDNFDPFYDPAIKRRNLGAVLDRDGYVLVEGDIRDAEAVERLFAAHSPEAVVHLAARAGVRPSIQDPAGYVSVNLDGTAQLLEACRRHGAGTFVFGSSSSVYGNNAKVPFAEDDPVDHPVSPYAATKKAGELLAHTYHHLFGLRVACLRFFTVYGPRQRPEMAIHRFARQLALGEEIEQFGDGRTTRDYTYISDIVEGILRALERCHGYHVWNLGGSRTISLAELVAKLAAGLGVTARVRQLPPQPGDVERTWADIGRAAVELDWSPQVDLERGLAAFLDWFRRQS
ncbi:MAG TPA: NAD-dependent epimerase/dehydratase family protein [Candidatus Polarisedimenticolaceae bacterium]|nr:NAD-dependent epimerase/dehydratase family protein [Candidatus Polarisedimenticolaceae bacterium]